MLCACIHCSRVDAEIQVMQRPTSLHNLHFGVSKLRNERTVKYLSSNSFLIGRPVKRRKSFLQVLAPVFHGRNLSSEVLDSVGELHGTEFHLSQVKIVGWGE